MSRQTMSFALPESMREYIDSRVSTGNYGNTSEYIRDLVRRDQEEQARKRLRDLIEEGLSFVRGRCKTRGTKRVTAATKPGPGWPRGWSRQPMPRLTRSNSIRA